AAPDGVGVGGQAHQEGGLVGPVGDGVHAPAPQALVNDLANGLLPARAVFARQVGAAKAKALGRAPRVMPFKGVAPGKILDKLRLVPREIFKPALALLDRRSIQRPNTIDAV